MTSSNWGLIKEIVDEAIRRKPDERRVFLAEACGSNESMRQEVESLLSSLEKAGGFMEAPFVPSDPSETAALTKGQMLGHYEISRELGKGGMGEVYLARDTKLERRVAIKVLNKKYERNEDNIVRFIREAKAASALNHPNILTIFEIGEVEGSQFIVSEFVEGRTLRETLKENKLDLSKIIDITCQVASALEAAHKARIIHRDIKPENIILRGDGYVKVLDFGLAKLLPQDDLHQLNEDPTLRQNATATGMILGTVNYMSPEQAKGKKIDERSDIFSLGVMLYEMITGKAPFAGDSVVETMVNLIEREPDPINSFVPDAPDEVQAVVSRMLAKLPEDRYGSVREVEEDLKAIGSGVSASLSDGTRWRISGNRTAVMQPVTEIRANATAENREPRVLRSRRWLLLTTLVVVVLAGVGIGGYILQQRTLSTSNEIRSVAVMPFVNESGNPDVEYLSDGMTDTLIASLSELPNIKVKARTSVFRYKGKNMDPKAIGSELGVQAIVNGRVTQREGRTSVALEVVNTSTEDVILSTTYDKPQAELVGLQSAIARDVSGKLRSKLSGAEEAKVTKAHTADPEALQLYLQGQFYRHKGGRSNTLRATDYFNKAINKDPNYALAYAGLALNYNSYNLYNLSPPSEYEPKALAAATRAVELDDSLPEAHVALGIFGGNAEHEFRRAIELNPSNADAHDSLCNLLTYQGRFDEAINEGKKAQELDPLSAVVATGLGASYAFARRPDEAIDVLRHAHKLDPNLFVPLGYLGFAQTLKGEYTDAISTFRRAMEVSDGSPNAKSHLAYALARAGQRDEALKLIDELKSQAGREYVSSFHFAIPNIALGDKDEAFFWIEKGVAEKSIGFASLSIHPWYDDLRSDARFAALLNRIDPSRS